jgi:hypothetical protein
MLTSRIPEIASYHKPGDEYAQVAELIGVIEVVVVVGGAIVVPPVPLYW